LAVLGQVTWSHPLWLWGAPVLGGVFLALTGALLIWDLEHPKRFHYIFTRPQWRSWLVRGGFLIGAYGLVLLIHFVATIFGVRDVQPGLGILGAPLAVMTAVYTAYLFAQAKARDLWQSPLMAPHLFVQAVLAGAAVMAPIAAWLAEIGAAGVFGPIASIEPQLPGVGPPHDATWLLLAIVAVASGVHLLFVLGETTLTHGTAHGRLASWEMTRGRHALWFRVGIVLVAVGLASPWLGAPAALAALAGIFAHEHAWVQAGQAVPLA
jgi:hypothetical protein